MLCATDPDSSLVVCGKRHRWESVSSQLRELVASHGLVLGYASFGAISLWEKLPYRSPQPFNDLEYFGFDSFFVVTDRGAWVFGKPKTGGALCGGRIEESSLVFERPGFEGYTQMVRKAKKHIFLGEIFQVVLARKIGVRFLGDYREVFLRLMARNPSPYMYYLKMGERRIVGSSPETLVRLSGRRVETYPIAGTRPLTGNKNRDEALRAELLSSPKDAAEHVMLVDLARNDLGKVSKLGSVKVTQYRRVVRYSHVQHLVSKVVGQLKEDMDALDTFSATFPAGTVSGAPKIRAIELIHMFEGETRGPYAGSVGYFMGPQKMDQAINIRSLYAVGEKCTVQAGAGIVAASDPASEYYETQSKAMAVLEALGVTREVVQT